jgi:hypothetical protein
MDATQTIQPVETGEALVAAFETPEHEVIELEGCSEAELEAKRRDLLAWAS